jgi:hypothetical protein
MSADPRPARAKGDASAGDTAAGGLNQAWQAYGAGDFAAALRALAALPEFQQADAEAAFLRALASRHAGDAPAARQAFQAVLQAVERLEDPTRRVMLRRLARGHLNRLDHGTWDLEPETWERT